VAKRGIADIYIEPRTAQKLDEQNDTRMQEQNSAIASNNMADINPHV
jgi:hypothetical protein